MAETNKIGSIFNSFFLIYVLEFIKFLFYIFSYNNAEMLFETKKLFVCLKYFSIYFKKT